MGSSGHRSFNTLIDAGFMLYRKKSSDYQIEFLLLQESQDNWGGLRGHVEDGESEYQVAVKMAKGGLNLEEGKDFIVVPDFKHGIGYEINNEKEGSKMCLVNLWLGEVSSNNYEIKLSSEYQSYKWLALEDAIDLFGENSRDLCWISCLKRCNEIIQKY